MIELLAPAGNLESLKAAVKSGANAVYLGLDEYNARGNIENFNRENLADAVRFAHLFGCKVYMTLNILIKDAEIEKVVENVRFALSCKVDAFIIQDVGVATLLKKIFALSFWLFLIEKRFLKELNFMQAHKWAFAI